MSKTLLMLIATGEHYHQYISQLLESASHFFIPHDAIIFTDCEDQIRGSQRIHQIKYPSYDFPEASLLRYHAFLSRKELLSEYDYVFYCDVDMTFVGKITEEDVLVKGIVATEHPGYIGEGGPVEKRLESTAFLEMCRPYFAGGFVGGSTEEFLEMSKTIAENIDEDNKYGILAIWHDESHLNKYLHDNPPSRILGPAFCSPAASDSTYYQDILKKADRQAYEPKLQVIHKVFDDDLLKCKICGRPVRHGRNISYGTPSKKGGDDAVKRYVLCGAHPDMLEVRMFNGQHKLCPRITAERMVRIKMGEIV